MSDKTKLVIPASHLKKYITELNYIKCHLEDGLDINIAIDRLENVIEEAEYDLKNAEKFTVSAQASAMGRLGGVKGGKARAAALSPERRSEIARKAYQARLAKKKEKENE